SEPFYQRGNVKSGPPRYNDQFLIPVASVNQFSSPFGELSSRKSLLGIQNIDHFVTQPGQDIRRGLGGADIKTPVDLPRIRGYNRAISSNGQAFSQCRLPGSGWSTDDQ